MTNSTSKNNKKEKTPSAVDDCADVTSRYKRFKEKVKKPEFKPINYEKPPHYWLIIWICVYKKNVLN